MEDLVFFCARYCSIVWISRLFRVVFCWCTRIPYVDFGHGLHLRCGSRLGTVVRRRIETTFAATTFKTTVAARACTLTHFFAKTLHCTWRNPRCVPNPVHGLAACARTGGDSRFVLEFLLYVGLGSSAAPAHLPLWSRVVCLTLVDVCYFCFLLVPVLFDTSTGELAEASRREQDGARLPLLCIPRRKVCILICSTWIDITDIV